jgi:hypothetical protein
MEPIILYKNAHLGTSETQISESCSPCTVVGNRYYVSVHDWKHCNSVENNEITNFMGLFRFVISNLPAFDTSISGSN